MKVILDKKLLYEGIWNKIYEVFKFNPSTDTNVKPFEFNVNYKNYKLKSIWNEEQEKIVNNIFKELSDDDIYALEWQSNCFEFNPNENIEYEYHYHDDDRNVEVYFPTYYPDGDYHFFIAKDFSYGLLGHPWRKEIYVFGDNLINKFESRLSELELVYNKISLEYKIVENFDKKILVASCDEVNGKILEYFLNGDAKDFNEQVMKRFKSVLSDSKDKISFSGNHSHVEINKETTKIFDILFDEELEDKYFEIDTKVIREIIIENYNRQVEFRNSLTKSCTNPDKKANYNHNKNTIISLTILVSLLVLLIISALIITFQNGNFYYSLISIIVCVIYSIIYFSKNNFNKKEKKLNYSVDKKIELRYFFDYGTTGCLWYDGVIEKEETLKEMGLSKKTIKKSIKLANEYQGCIDWNNPHEYLWEEKKWCDFIKRANNLYTLIKAELKDNYMVINEIETHKEIYKKYNLNQIYEKLIKIFPEQKERIKHSIKYNNDKFLGHVYFGDEFNTALIELLRNNTEIKIIKKYCDFIEFMWKNGDEEVINIVDVTILERLSDDEDIWNKFGENISIEFKEYINNDLIPNNIMMNHVSKL